MRTEPDEGQTIRIEWIRKSIKDVLGGGRTKVISKTRPTTMYPFVDAVSLPRSRSSPNRRDSTSTWTSSIPSYSKKYSPVSLTKLIRERAMSRSWFWGTLDAQGTKMIICDVHPKPFSDKNVTDMCVGLLEHVKLSCFDICNPIGVDDRAICSSESPKTCQEALESILDLIAAFPYLRTVFQGAGVEVALDRLYAAHRTTGLDERMGFLFDQALKAIHFSTVNESSRWIHYSRGTHVYADNSDICCSLRGLVRRCQYL